MLAALRYPLLLILAALLAGCLDEIDLGQADDLPEGIVVRGRLNVEADGAEVLINLEQLFQFSSNLPDRIVTADVRLENTEGQSVTLPYRDGAYRLTIGRGNPDFTIRPGVGYRLDIVTREGEAYASEYDVLQEPLAPTALTATPEIIIEKSQVGTDVEVPVLRYRIDTPLRYADGAPAYFRHTAERVYALTVTAEEFPVSNPNATVCYLSATVAGNQALVISGRDLGGSTVEGLSLFVDPVDYRYAQGHYLTVYQDAIGPDAFTYFEQIAAIADREQSIFSNPPGPIVGNVVDVNGRTANVFGFFYTANRSVIRRGVTPNEAGNPGQFCPPPPSNGPGNPPIICDDCLLGSNSTLVRPAYWAF